jgi:predicted Zn-dependent protease
MNEPEFEAFRPGGGPRPTRRFGSSRQFLLGIVVLVILAIAGRFGVPPLYGVVKASRARKAALSAERMVEADRLEEAARLSRVAYELGPNEPEVLRVVALLSARLGRPESVTYFMAYRATGRMNLDERIAMAEAAIRFGRVDVARPVLAELTTESPTNRHVWRLAQAHARQAGDLGRSIALARSVVSQFGGDAEAEYELATQLLRTRKPPLMGEGRRILWGLALGRTSIDQAAAQALAQLPVLTPSESETLARVLESGANKTLPRSLLALQLKMRSHPERGDEWLGKAVALVPTNGPVPDVCQLVLWLTERDGLKLAAGHLPEARCRTNLLLMAARLDFLVGVDDSAGLEAAVADKENVLDSGMRSAALGALAAKQGKRDEAERAFRAALDAAGSRVILVAPFVAREAERYRMTPVAVQALQLWMEAPGMGMEAARRILRLLESDPNPRQALETLRKLHAKLPTEESVILERAWLELLAGENPAWALGAVVRLAEQRPDDATLRFVQALAEWRNGKAAAALTTVEKVPVELESLNVRQQVVYALVLGANDQREAARRIVRGIPEEPATATYELLLKPWR